MSYKQLTQEQRYQTYALLKMGHNQSEIANVIGVHKSTISRELWRNCGRRGYRPQQAHRMAISSARAITEAITHLLEPWSKDVHTITADNGKEFAQHEEVSRILKVEVFLQYSVALSS